VHQDARLHTTKHARKVNMRVAALDVGSRSFHILIASLQSGARFLPVANMKEIVRLGAGMSSTGEISQEKFEVAATALTRLRQFAKEHEARALIAYGTSAIREAKNCGQFLYEMRVRSGVEIQPISEQEEARLVHLALQQHLPKKRLSCIVDVGGGSVELALVTAGSLHRSISFPLGVQRLAEQYPATEGLSRDAILSLTHELTTRLTPFLEEAKNKGVRDLFLTGGSMRALHTAAKEPTAVLHFDTLRGLTERLTSLAVNTLETSCGVPSERTETAAVSSILAKTIYELLAVDEAQVCRVGLREGIIVDHQRRFGRAIISGAL
jgi:exopolyphosphatase/guanosine-5'-triphosphate,3'-diphosphate pyrophosphatase